MTIILEVKSNSTTRTNEDFYNPATSDFKKYPRTENGANKVISEMIEIIQNNSWIIDYRFKVYDGRYEYYKPTKLLYTINSDGEITM